MPTLCPNTPRLGLNYPQLLFSAWPRLPRGARPHPNALDEQVYLAKRISRSARWGAVEDRAGAFTRVVCRPQQEPIGSARPRLGLPRAVDATRPGNSRNVDDRIEVCGKR